MGLFWTRAEPVLYPSPSKLWRPGHGLKTSNTWVLEEGGPTHTGTVRGELVNAPGPERLTQIQEAMRITIGTQDMFGIVWSWKETSITLKNGISRTHSSIYFVFFHNTMCLPYFSNVCWTLAKQYFTCTNPYHLFGFRGVPPLPFLPHCLNTYSHENRHWHRNYWWVMLAIHTIQWLRASWGATKSFPTTWLLGVVPKNAGTCWNRMIWKKRFCGKKTFF